MDNTDLRTRVEQYRNYDEARQQHLEHLVDQVQSMGQRLHVLQADLEDEQNTRRAWRRRAEDAESSLTRSQFVLVLIDGDGYYFKDVFLREALDAGGARAAYQILTEVRDYLQHNNLLVPGGSDLEIMVNVYANRNGLARFLCEADRISSLGQLDQFFCSFNQSQSLFQFIDCGYGKERADAKFRDTYKFYTKNAHCKHIFLACCHDNGYVAELDRYRHDPQAIAKTILVHAAPAAREYSSLPFAMTRFSSVFEEETPQIPKPLATRRERSPSIADAVPVDDAASQASNEAIVSVAPPPVAQTWSAMASQHQKSSTKIQLRPASALKEEQGEPRGIPVNRFDERVDLTLRQPTGAELAAFDQRIAKRKLCNRHHLSKHCSAGRNCTFDHDPVSPTMLNTLKTKARSIPCSQGHSCRQADCYYGHHCPWGKTGCANPKCAFHKVDLHNLSDAEIAKFVPAEY